MPAKAKKSVPAAMAVAPYINSESEAAINWTPLFSPMSLNSLADFSRDNIAAMTKANLALSEGLQAIGHELLAYATSALERASQTATALLGARTSTR